MAKHKDIDRASALLEGVQGWHIENVPYQRKTDRPDKCRCIFMIKFPKLVHITRKYQIAMDHQIVSHIENFNFQCTLKP